MVASRLEGEEDAEDDDVEQALLWRVWELHYTAVNVGRNKKTTCAILAPPPNFFCIVSLNSTPKIS